MHSLKTAPLSQKDRWPEYLDWMTKTVTAFDKVFRQRVRNLSGNRGKTSGKLRFAGHVVVASN
jgi:hypothetical protein